MSKHRAELYIEEGYRISAREGHDRALLMMRMAFRMGFAMAIEEPDFLADHESLGVAYYDPESGVLEGYSTTCDTIVLSREDVEEYKYPPPEEDTYMLRYMGYYGTGATKLAEFLAEEAPKLVPEEH